MALQDMPWNKNPQEHTFSAILAHRNGVCAVAAAWYVLAWHHRGTDTKNGKTFLMGHGTCLSTPLCRTALKQINLLEKYFTLLQSLRHDYGEGKFLSMHSFCINIRCFNRARGWWSNTSSYSDPNKAAVLSQCRCKALSIPASLGGYLVGQAVCWKALLPFLQVQLTSINESRFTSLTVDCIRLWIHLHCVAC